MVSISSIACAGHDQPVILDITYIETAFKRKYRLMRSRIFVEIL